MTLHLQTHHAVCGQNEEKRIEHKYQKKHNLQNIRILNTGCVREIAFHIDIK